MRLITLYHAYAARVVATLAGVIMLSVFLYGALLLGAVAHAAGATKAERQVRDLDQKVSKLEASYLNATKALSPERAKALGFVAPESVAVVYVNTPTLTLANQAAAR